MPTSPTSLRWKVNFVVSCSTRMSASAAASRSRGLKVAGQNLSLADPVVGEKTVGRFGVCPVLTGQGDAPSDFIGELLQKLSQPLTMAFIFELAPC